MSLSWWQWVIAVAVVWVLLSIAVAVVWHVARTHGWRGPQ